MDQRGFSLQKIDPGIDPACLYLELSGMLDNHNSSQFSQAILENAKQGLGVGIVRMDIGGLCYASSTGIGALIEAMLHLRRIGIDFCLVNTPVHIMAIIELLGFRDSLVFE